MKTVFHILTLFPQMWPFPFTASSLRAFQHVVKCEAFPFGYCFFMNGLFFSRMTSPILWQCWIFMSLNSVCPTYLRWIGLLFCIMSVSQDGAHSCWEKEVSSCTENVISLLSSGKQCLLHWSTVIFHDWKTQGMICALPLLESGQAFIAEVEGTLLPSIW